MQTPKYQKGDGPLPAIKTQTPCGQWSTVFYDGSRHGLILATLALYQTGVFRAVEAYWNGRTVASHGAPLVVIG